MRSSSSTTIRGPNQRPPLTALAAPLGAGLYLSDVTHPEAAPLAAAFGERMRPIGARLAVLRR
jgi:hypothetical protein